MIYPDCINYDGDEDCNKCVAHGYIYGCEGCKEYEDHYGRKKMPVICEEWEV